VGDLGMDSRIKYKWILEIIGLKVRTGQSYFMVWLMTGF
jgi:hypothetical protein